MDKKNVVHSHNGIFTQQQRNNDILKFAGKWMELENIILREITQTQKDKYDMYLFISGF